MSERQEQPQPRAVWHIGDDILPNLATREEMPDEELEVVMREVVECFTDFWRRTNNNPDLIVSYEIFPRSTESP